ncbi:hypothetical protein [Streptomyces sp. TR02-1]|uniref:hypothetical protein n=1 Tax=Streptomyces sp. TR02-1 TaxID=3385977 RepID=UPI0039A1AFD6
MDDQLLYGPVLFELELMEAVERGLLARWEIDVLEITDPHAPEPGSETAEEAQGQRLAALQARGRWCRCSCSASKRFVAPSARATESWTTS